MDESGYPHELGYQQQANGATTSKDAAQTATAGAKGMAADVLALLQDHGPKSPEELVGLFKEKLGKRVLLTSVRARCTQLFRLHKIEDSGSRGLGESGRCKVIRWRVRLAAVQGVV